jgi:predicted unusual protein kinase regulating ubiquinone biosynthesis (AarF/ABC1/UbiB family)
MPKKKSRSAIRRLFFIVFQLIKHLGGYLVYATLRRLRLARPSRRGGIWSDLSRPVRVRLFIQEVDGALIKFGQILAMRVDFLPEDYIAELLKLLDEVPPFDPLIARRIVEKELHANIDDLFQVFETEPLAAASFGQVHAAILHNGDKVIVKVQRPAVSATIAADLKLFRVAALLIDATGLTKRTPLKTVYEDFAVWTREELDYRVEGAHIQEVYDKAVGSRTERIPKVYWSHTADRVLTLERLFGIWVKEIIERLQTDKKAVHEELAARNTDLMSISQNLLRNTLRQIFVYGIYHADPHAANLLVMNDGVIGYVDFGITGRIGAQAKETQVRIHVALEAGDFEKFYLAILETIAPPQGADLAGFKKAVERGYSVWLSSQYMGHGNIRDKSFARLMLKLNNATQRYGLAFRSVEVRIFRALATVDAVLLQFAPTLDVRSEFRHFFGAYQIINVATDKLPTLAHKLPALLDMLSECLDHTVLVQTAYVSKFRKGLGVIFQIASLALVAFVLIAFFMPVTLKPVLASLSLGRAAATLLLLLGILVFAWIGYVLKLRSVIHDTVMEHHRNTICSHRD